MAHKNNIQIYISATSDFHEPPGGNGYSHYPSLLVEVFDTNGVKVLSHKQDILSVDPQWSKDEAVKIAEVWCNTNREKSGEALIRWMND